MLSPFPIVKIAGLAYARKTKITKIGVVAPRGAVASVKCVGKKACPDVTRRKRARPKHTRLRFKTFERYLPAGARLIVVIQKRNRIGKYVSVKLRRSKEPLRVDRCVNPGKKKPRPCPSF